MKISQEVRDIEAAKAQGMASQAERFKAEGSELYHTRDGEVVGANS